MDNWEIIFYNVGQGDATRIRLPDGSNILIDTGPDVKNGNPVVWWAKQYGIGPIRSIVITHNHGDHFGGLSSIIGCNDLIIEEVFFNNDCFFRNINSHEDLKNLYSQLSKRSSQTGIPKVKFGAQGDVVYSDENLMLKIVRAAPTNHKDIGDDPNLTSMVLALYHKSDKELPIVVWGGDAHLQDVFGAINGAKPVILVGPHHGSPQDKDFSDICKNVLSDKCPDCIFSSLGGKYNNQPKRQYVISATKGNSVWCCTRISKQCNIMKDGKPVKCDVYRGSAMIGVKIPSNIHECRGSMRIKITPGGEVQYDIHQERFLSKVRQLAPNRHCNLSN